jgi:hypothetical protein
VAAGTYPAAARANESVLSRWQVFFNGEFMAPRIPALLLLFTFLFNQQQLSAQKNIEVKSAFYNTLIGGFSGGIGALINRKENERWQRCFARGFVTGCGGGLVAYGGKKMTSFIAAKNELGYGWLSRVVYSAGNSVVENASANRHWASQWHMDLAFIRVEIHSSGKVQPRIMPSNLGGTVLLALNGEVDPITSLRSGTLTFRTEKIRYAPYLSGSTTGNCFILHDSLKGRPFYRIYPHEMIHTYQFQDFSGVNSFFNPLSDKWKKNKPAFNSLSKWVYLDLNYELFLLDYFILQGGVHKGYKTNFLENEAEYLSVGLSANRKGIGD